MAHVLVIDDDKLIGTLVREVLTQRGHQVSIASNGERGLELFREHRPAVTVLDLSMPGMNGLEVLTQIKAFDPVATVIVLTGAGLHGLEAEAKSLGVMTILYKGSSLQLLTKILDELSKVSEGTLSPPA